SSLMELQPEEAVVIIDGTERIIPVTQLKVGDKILVRASERIPADGTIVKGHTGVDESVITVESIPVSKGLNQEVFAGTVALDGMVRIIPVTQLKVDDKILVRASQRIPADVTIDKVYTGVDESAITGESIPVSKVLNQEVFAGTVALDGSIFVEITKQADETLFQKIIQMVQSAQDEKSPTQLFIERFEGTYVKIVLAVVIIMMFLLYLIFVWWLTVS